MSERDSRAFYLKVRRLDTYYGEKHLVIVFKNAFPFDEAHKSRRRAI